MPANFPSSPTLNQQYTYNELTWQYNGRFWQLVTTADYMGATGPVGATGSTGPTPDLGNLYSGLAPNVSTIYDLGTASKQWGNLFLSNVIYLGPTSISITANGAIQLPPGSYVGNLEIGTGAGGSNTHVQFNQGGILGGSANLTFDGSGISSRYFSPTGSTGPTGAIFQAASGTVGISGNIQVTQLTNVFVEQNNYPEWPASLTLDLVKTRTIDPRINTQRTSTASYFDGRAVRYQEENLIIQSQNFEINTAWSYSTNSSITTDSTTAPDGTATAESFVMPAEARNHYITQTSTVMVPGETYTFSIFAKQNQRRYVQISIRNQNMEFVNFDLQTGTVTMRRGLITPEIHSYGNSWYRLIVSSRCVTTDRHPWVSVISQPYASLRESWTPTASDSVYIWGAQLERKPSVTDYQATTINRLTSTFPKLVYAPVHVPRLDYDPVTGLIRGLLIEDQKTNLLSYSEDFANTNWALTGSSIRVNAMVAPDGNVAFDRLIENSSASQHSITRSMGSLSSQNYTFSVFLKPAGRTWAEIGWNDGSTDRSCYFDLTSGNTGTATGTAVPYVANIGGGIYRCGVTHSSNVATIFIRSASANGTNSYTGNGVSGLYVWGAQLEADSFMSSYIPNQGNVTSTRNADTITVIGTSFNTNWYNPVEGTILIETSSFGNVVGTSGNTIVGANAAANIAGNIVPFSAHYIYTMSLHSSWGTTQHEMVMRYPGIASVNTYNVAYFDANIAQTINKNTVTVQVLSYANNNTVYFQDGVFSSLDTNVSIPQVIDRISIGNRGNAPTTNGPLNGYVRRLIYYPERLTNAQITTISSL